MADEIRVNSQITITKNGATTTASKSVTDDMTGDIVLDKIISVGTSAEEVSLEDLGTPGWLFFQNLDAISYIEYSHDGLNWGVKISAGNPSGPFEASSPAVWLKATSGSANCRVVVVEA